MPAEQIWPEVHFLPQAPQLLTSLVSWTQVPEQLLSPLWQVNEQAPEEHACPAAQVFPHLPQWVLSL